jgi:hypothetical protein
MVSHLAWTEAFQKAIEEKRVTDEIAFCGCDDLCPFGKWLYSLEDDVKHRKTYRRVKDLHYRFHDQAGEIVRLIKTADFAGAITRLTGDYAATSGQLLLALQDWRDAEDESATSQNAVHQPV